MRAIQKILVAVDVETGGGVPLERAVQVARRFRAQLVVVDVVPELTWSQRMILTESQALQQLIVRDRATRLRRIVRAPRGRGLDAHGKLLAGRTGEQLIRLVQRGKFDLLVRATKGPHSRRQQFFSGTAFELLRNCPCPIWLCDPQDSAGKIASAAVAPAAGVSPAATEQELSVSAPVHPTLLVAIDPAVEGAQLRELNINLLRLGELLTSLLGGTLHVLHAWNIQGEGLVKDYMQTTDFVVLEQAIQKRSGELLCELLQESGVEVPPERLHLVRGEASTEIARFVQERAVHTLILGTLGRSGLAGLLMGNTAEMLFHQIRCSVAALKPADFVSRVRLRPRRSVASG
ncbi:MAG: universal stress protein [Planctomycetota bacterium]